MQVICLPNLIILVSAMINVEGAEEGMSGNTACKVLWHTHVQHIKKKQKKGSSASKNLLSIRDQRIFIATSLSAPH